MPIHDVLVARLRRLSIVPRWTIVPTINQQSTADHSFHVSWIALWLTQYHCYQNLAWFEREVLIYAIVHDSSESISGDFPSSIKEIIQPHFDFKTLDEGMIPQISNATRNVVKVADCIDALLFLKEEMSMGNKRIQDVYNDVQFKANKSWYKFDWKYDKMEKPKLEYMLDRLNQAINGANS